MVMPSKDSYVWLAALKVKKPPAVIPGPTSAPPFLVTIPAIHSAMRVFMFVYVILSNQSLCKLGECPVRG